ncbi:uncharacterized protein RCC_00543 [Ramularia collo-cygni]|uniref:Uncharacterized protein n=1 Tax=Ramularia collo-cygni TaxID=112498 RepID=A0A2D3UN29_9PEZI|nr:uncharacterized protein RCC_00543 [Ramularia collo-cygni]CZT14568.1 uncharacterized protein RCC_00543 [Ramularia collo-cygni]
MTLPKFALDYNACSLEELRRFCENRKLLPSKELHATDADADQVHVAAPMTLPATASDRLDDSAPTPDEMRTIVPGRSQDEALSQPGTAAAYINALRSADANANISVKFLDLPGELRNGIYDCLLLLRTRPAGNDSRGYFALGRHREAAYCYPEILATCKAIHREATKTLYEMNTFRLDYIPFEFPVCHIATPGELNMTTFLQLPKWIHMGVLQARWAQRLLGCRSIHIALFNGHVFNEADKIIFHSLMSMLQTSDKLKSVTISTSSIREYAAHG